MANEVAIKFSEQLSDKLALVNMALPKDLNKERFVQNCLAVMNENPALAKINTAQVIQGLMKGAYLGLDFLSKECYLIPYGSSVQFQTDYKGEIKFTKKYSIRKIQDIYAKVVRDGDEFIEEIIDGHPTIQFRPRPFSKEAIIGAFAVVLFKDGGMLYEVMSVDDINSVRNNYSKASNSKAWKNSFDEMCKKTVLRRLCKHIETDFESVEAHAAWEEGGDAEFTNSVSRVNRSDEVVDVFSQEDITDENIIDVEAIEKEMNQTDFPEGMK